MKVDPKRMRFTVLLAAAMSALAFAACGSDDDEPSSPAASEGTAVRLERARTQLALAVDQRHGESGRDPLGDHRLELEDV